MKRVLVYSHDTYGLGNVRITLAVCQKLIESIPGIAILVVSGSPMIHSFKLPKEVDYIKLPCLRRTEANRYTARFLGTETQDILKMRSEMIVMAVEHFRPDVLIVDKKPYGVASDLKEVLGYFAKHLPETKKILLFRDILDKPEVTKRIWRLQGNLEAIEAHYDLVLSFGFPEVFDIRAEYGFPQAVSDRVEFIGHIQPRPGKKSRADLREALGLDGEKMVLVTPGGGEDGHRLLEAYVQALAWMPDDKTRHLLVCGPEMPKSQRETLKDLIDRKPNVMCFEFIDDMTSYMDAADLIVAMGGYNTVCEILALEKPAVLVPRYRPVAEQWIRADRMSRLGFFSVIHPDQLSPGLLAEKAMQELLSGPTQKTPGFKIHFRALDNICHWVSQFTLPPQVKVAK